MFNVGRLCVKVAGRDANKKCVIVEELDNGFVLIDGETRRRKCNTLHLEPLAETVSLKSGASFADVKKIFAGMDIELVEKKSRSAKPRPKKARKSAKVEEAPKAKKTTKKAKKD